jgi:hypothetical protein
MIGALMYNLASLKLIFIWAEFSLGKKEIVVMEAEYINLISNRLNDLVERNNALRRYL